MHGIPIPLASDEVIHMNACMHMLLTSCKVQLCLTSPSDSAPISIGSCIMVKVYLALQVAQGSLTGGKENAVQSLKRPQAAFSPQVDYPAHARQGL